jgi:hypothetical protein
MPKRSHSRKGLPSDALADECFYASYAFAALSVPHVFDIGFQQGSGLRIAPNTL